MDLKDFIEHTGYQMQTTFWDDFSVAEEELRYYYRITD